MDELWTNLLAGGGREDRCGWLQDRYEQRERAGRAMQAMLGMGKIDIAGQQAAFDGR